VTTAQRKEQLVPEQTGQIAQSAAKLKFEWMLSFCASQMIQNSLDRRAF